jgi:30S ribosomal protein S31
MGKGDGRSRRGKIFKASYGNTRPKTKGVSKTLKPKAPSVKKAPATKKAK